MPWLAALVCCSAFDLALHDAYGVLHGVPTYETYNAEFMNADLAAYLTPAEGADVSFAGRYPGRLPRLAPPRRVARLAPGRRQGPARRVGVDRRRARRRLSRAAPRLDPPRRPEMPEGQAPRRRPRLGLRPAASGSARSPSRRGSTGSPPTSTARSTTRRTSTTILDRLLVEHPRLYGDAPLRRAAVPLRPGGAPDRRPQRLGTQAAVHGRERPRLAPRSSSAGRWAGRAWR